MKYIFASLVNCMFCISSTFSQIDTTYIAISPIDTSTGLFSFELRNAQLSQLIPAQSLWVYGDGNFEIKQYDALTSTHQFRISPVEEVTLYSVGNYDDNDKPPKKHRGTGNLTTAFTPTGANVTQTGWVEQGHFAAIKMFPSVLNHQSTPVAIMALYNHQNAPVSGSAHLYYKTTLERNGEDNDPVSYSVYKTHFSYGNVSATDTTNAPVKVGYQALCSWNFTDLQPDEERHLFVSLDTTPSWQNISDINTANYRTEFLLVVKGYGSYAFEKEVSVSSALESSHDPAFLSVSFGPDEAEEDIIFDLLFYNEGSMPVRNIQVEFHFPNGVNDQDFQILEKSIGPVGFAFHPNCTENAKVLNFEAKNVGLGKYDPLNPNTYGKIIIKAKMPRYRWEEVRAFVKFDNLPAEKAHWGNVPDLQH